MKLIDFPRNYSIAEYDRSIQKVILKLAKDPAVKSIYQVGSVSAPGISDVDLWVVFHDGKTYTDNPLENLTPIDRYFFCHNLFGLNETNYCESQKYEFFHDFKLLSGAELKDSNREIRPAQPVEVTRQAALEYVLKALVVLSIEREFGVIKVRNFLLHTKALLLDLEPLGFDQYNLGLRELLNRILEVRKQWFLGDIDENSIKELHEQLYVSLAQNLGKYFKANKFWHVNRQAVDIGTNLTINDARVFDVQSRGVRLPAFFTGLSRKMFNLQRRFLRLNYNLPFTDSDPTGDLLDRYRLLNSMILYNKKHLPSFAPVAYGLPIFEVDTN